MGKAVKRGKTSTQDKAEGSSDGRLKVLYMHGLESGPQGRKANLLRDHFNVAVPALELWKLRSPRYNKRLAMPAAVLCTYLLSAILTAVQWSRGVAGNYLAACVFAIILCSGYLLMQYCRRVVMEDMLIHSLGVMRATVRHFQPDVVVGSSWGGAVCAYAIGATRALKSFWTGPTLLLAPAHYAIGRYGAVSAPTFKLPCDQPISILHGTEDRTVPVTDSIRLADTGGPKVRLHLAHGADHRLSQLSATHLSDLIHAIASSAGDSFPRDVTLQDDTSLGKFSPS